MIFYLINAIVELQEIHQWYFLTSQKYSLPSKVRLEEKDGREEKLRIWHFRSHLWNYNI
jgi:hypothetical protein